MLWIKEVEMVESVDDLKSWRRCFCSRVDSFWPVANPSGRPWTLHANPMSMVLLDEDVKVVCDLGFATNSSPSDAPSRAPSTIATCVWQVWLRRLILCLPRLTPRLPRLPRLAQRPLLRNQWSNKWFQHMLPFLLHRLQCSSTWHPHLR